ncbi:TNT domain-containing protein [Lentzea sp. BCCO 10_0856]|uniref:TNT domain-containing protein n=1 Tax=Lentzea miocenica TaxID=3095431 RepID=A0ABU4T647_9PSEU|nr:TNT domain-containing protein [Lentzea sp. BCCO 10_0856]MDX8033626.1 TNT domain-containing protein [Lentzea sp. BCCO 10_0856]
MGIELPAELAAVAAKAGVSWPKADEDAMRSSATAWREAGDKIKGLGTSSDGAATHALNGLTGSTGDAARGRWAKVVAPDGDLQRAARGCHAAADRLDHAAKQVGAAKVEIVRELVTLAKNNDAANASASAGNPNALLGLDTLTRGAAANVANLHNTLSSAIRLDSGVDMTQGSQPVNTAPGAHGPGGGGGGLLSPVTNIVGGVVAPVAGVVAPIVEPVAAVVAPVTETVAPVVGAVTAPVAPVVGAVTAPVAPVVGAVTDAAAPILDAAAPVTAPAAAVVQPVVDAVPGGRDAVGPVFETADGHGRGDGNGQGDGPGRGDGPGQGEGRPQGLPGVVADVGQVVGPVAPPAAHVVADVIPSVHGSLGPIAEGTTQASAAVLEQPLIRGDVPSQTAAAPQASAPAAPTAPTGPPMGGAPMGGAPVSGPMGGPVGAVGGAVGGVPSAAPVAGSQVGAVAGQQGAAQAAGQQAQQGQAGQQAAKAADAKAAAEAKAVEAKVGEAKAGEAKSGSQVVSGKTGAPGAVPATGQASQFGGQASSQAGQVQGTGQPGQASPGTQASGSAQGPQTAVKDAGAKDLTKDALDALQDGSSDGSAVEERGARQVGDTITAPAAPLAGVDLGGALTDRLENREQSQALVNPGLVGDIVRHSYTAVAAGSWFMAIFLSAGQAPRLAPKPARQLPALAQRDDERQVPRFAPQDHPQAELVATTASHPMATTDGLGKDHPVVQELTAGYDALAGMHERDWESLFQHEDGTPRWPVEREGGYEDSQPEVLKEGVELDRFGTPEGRVLSQAATPFAQRSLPPAALDEGYRRYRVVKELPVHRTISAPWFGQPGGGSRYRTTYPVADLVALGYLTEITA